MLEDKNMREAIISDLVACKAAFDKVRIPWVIVGGVVLGYGRYKDVMAWDTDLDINVCVPLSGDIWKTLHKALVDYGFTDLSSSRADFMHCYRETEFNIMFFYKVGNYYESYPRSTPGLKFVEKSLWYDEIQTAEFLGDKYPIPNHLDDFLEAHYGADWETNIVKDHEIYFKDKRGGRNQKLWVKSRAGKNGDLWPKILATNDTMEKE